MDEQTAKEATRSGEAGAADAGAPPAAEEQAARASAEKDATIARQQEIINTLVGELLLVSERETAIGLALAEQHDTFDRQAQAIAGDLTAFEREFQAHQQNVQRKLDRVEHEARELRRLKDDVLARVHEARQEVALDDDDKRQLHALIHSQQTTIETKTKQVDELRAQLEAAARAAPPPDVPTTNSYVQQLLGKEEEIERLKRELADERGRVAQHERDVAALNEALALAGKRQEEQEERRRQGVAQSESDLQRMTFELKQTRETSTSLQREVIELSRMLNDEKRKNAVLHDEVTKRVQQLDAQRREAEQARARAEGLQQRVLDEDSRQILFNYVALGIKLMDPSQATKNIDLTELYNEVEQNHVPIAAWAEWVHRRLLG